VAASLYIALLSVLLYYLIYFRHFFSFYRQEGYQPAYIKLIESFLYGVALALIILIAAPYITILLPGKSAFHAGFYKAALVEKLGAVLAIILIQRHFRNFTIIEGAISGLLVGAGFSLVEDIFYSLQFGYSVIMARILFSVPLHLATCGMIGYYIGLYNISTSPPYKAIYLVKALLLPFLFHGTFDSLLLLGDARAYLVAPLTISLIGTLELIITQAKLIPPPASLSAQNLRFEDWVMKYRQPRYERWILNSMGTKSGVRFPLFKPVYNPLWWSIALLLIIAAVILTPFRSEITSALKITLSIPEQLLMLSVFPSSLGIIMMMVGALNPDFFRYSVMRIPVIIDAVLCDTSEEETLVTFDVSPVNCFIRTFESIQTPTTRNIYFQSGELKSPRISMQVVWENHGELKDREPTGSIVKLITPGRNFYSFILRYYLFRLRKGIIFNLKLPGFEGVRRLFMRPATIMQKTVIYQPGSTVFRKGDDEYGFFYIKKGRVDIYKELDSGEKILIESIGEGQIFNEMSLLGESKRNVTAQCPVRSILSRAHPDNLEALIRYNPDFAIALVRKLAERVDNTQIVLAENLEYLQKMLQRKDDTTKTIAVIFSLLLGGTVSGSSIRVNVDTSSVTKRISATSDEVIRYLMRRITHKNDDARKEQPAEKNVEDALMNAFSELSIELIAKKR